FAFEEVPSMHGRVIRMKGDPARTDEDLKLWTQNILPLIKSQKGFAGVSLMGNRKTGDGLSVAYWETEQDMKAARAKVRPEADKSCSGTIWDTEKDLQNSEAAVAGIRKDIAGKVGPGAPKVEAFEVLYTEIPAAVVTR